MIFLGRLHADLHVVLTWRVNGNFPAATSQRGEVRKENRMKGGEWPRYPRLLLSGSRSPCQNFLEVTKSCQEFLSLGNQSLGLGQEHVRIQNGGIIRF